LLNKVNWFVGAFAGISSRNIVNLVDGAWYQFTDADFLANLMGTLLWCAKHAPGIFADAMALNEDVRRCIANGVFGGEEGLDKYLSYVRADGHTQAAGHAASAKYVDGVTRFLTDFVQSALIDPADFAGFVAGAISQLVTAIREDSAGFAQKVGKEIYDGFMADCENGDYASAFGRLSAVAVDAFLGSKGIGQTGRGIGHVINRARTAPNNLLGGKKLRDVRPAEANAGFGKPPYDPSKSIVDFRADGTTQYVRVYNTGANSSQSGHWLMKADDIQGLSPQQIKDKFDLPELPTRITDFKPPKNTRIRIGTVNSGNFGGNVGGIYFELRIKIPDSTFTNPRSLNSEV